MKYIFLIYASEKNWDGLTDDVRKEIFEAHDEFTKAAQEAGKYLGGEGLQLTRTATTVSIKEGKTVHTDGPFIETKEALGGFYMLDCTDLDDALAWAARIPEAKRGSIEVRPVMVFN